MSENLLDEDVGNPILASMPKVDLREFVALLRDGMSEETAMEMVLQEWRGRFREWRKEREAGGR